MPRCTVELLIRAHGRDDAPDLRNSNTSVVNRSGCSKFTICPEPTNVTRRTLGTVAVSVSTMC
jgi:hypothetical protein